MHQNQWQHVVCQTHGTRTTISAASHSTIPVILQFPVPAVTQFAYKSTNACHQMYSAVAVPGMSSTG